LGILLITPFSLLGLWTRIDSFSLVKYARIRRVSQGEASKQTTCMNSRLSGDPRRLELRGEMATWKCAACNWSNAGKWTSWAFCGLAREASAPESETTKQAIANGLLSALQDARLKSSKSTSSGLTLSGCVAVGLLAGGILLLLGNLWRTLFSYYAAPTEWWLASLALTGLGVLFGPHYHPRLVRHPLRPLSARPLGDLTNDL